MTRKLRLTYFCNPWVNVICKKTDCYMHGGECHKTTDLRFAARTPAKSGKWVNGFCTFCGHEAITEWNETGGEYAFTKFCSNCGAVMEREVIEDGKITIMEWE